MRSDNQSNILSTPSIMTLDNQEARILVGQEIPITTGEALSPNFDNAFRTVQRQNVGITLEVRPQINAGGTIKLDLRQEVSSIAGPVSVDFQDLILNKREIETTITVDDGEIVGIGGLLDDNDRRTLERDPAARRHPDHRQPVPLARPGAGADQFDGVHPPDHPAHRRGRAGDERAALRLRPRPAADRQSEPRADASTSWSATISARSAAAPAPQPDDQVVTPTECRRAGAAAMKIARGEDQRARHPRPLRLRPAPRPAADRGGGRPARRGDARGRRPQGADRAAPLPRPAVRASTRSTRRPSTGCSPTSIRRAPRRRPTRRARSGFGDDLGHLAAGLPSAEDLLDTSDDAPAIRLINGIIADAARQGVSDIHIEPYETGLVVRMRMDGVLRETLRMPAHVAPVVVSRVKVMARLDIAERRLPQDGRIGLTLGGKLIDVRVSTLPSRAGERVVLRILDKENAGIDLEMLGMTRGGRTRCSAARSPSPTASSSSPARPARARRRRSMPGLKLLNDGSRNILTVEDPVEYAVDGVGQTQINPQVGLTFAAGLRAILRQDPDVVMVGEIRDRETADIAVQAALTGHLVLSTVHTNDAIGAITRLRDMKVEPFLIASTVRAVIAQRLVRRLCAECRAPVEATGDRSPPRSASRPARSSTSRRAAPPAARAAIRAGSACSRRRGSTTRSAG